MVSSSSTTSARAPSMPLILISYRETTAIQTSRADACTPSSRLRRSPRGRNEKPPLMTSLASHSGATSPTTLRRRSGRERPQVLTSAFHRYVERVQSATDPTPRTDLAATLRLAAEIVGSGRIDAAAGAEHGPEIRQLARNVRQAGRAARAPGQHDRARPQARLRLRAGRRAVAP